MSYLIYIKEMRNSVRLTKSEEQLHAQNWQKNSSKKDREILIKSNFFMVYKIAKWYNTKTGVDLSDLISEGNFGLLKASDMFNSNLNYRFSTYSAFWIKSFINDFVLKNKSIVKRKKKRSENDKNNSTPFVSDVSLNRKVGDDESDEWIDLYINSNFENEETTFILEDQNKKRGLAFKEGIELLSEKEKEVIKKRYLNEEPETLKEISESINLSPEGVRQIEKRAIKKITEFLKRKNL